LHQVVKVIVQCLCFTDMVAAMVRPASPVQAIVEQGNDIQQVSQFTFFSHLHFNILKSTFLLSFSSLQTSHLINQFRLCKCQQ